MTADAVTSTRHIRAKNKKISGRLVRSATASGRTVPHVKGAALVSPVPGTTRDVKGGRGRLAGVDFHLVDTAGIDVSAMASASSRGDNKGASSSSSSWMRDALRQTALAASQADVVFLLVDGQLPRLTSDVHETAETLRRLPPKQEVAGSRPNGSGEPSPGRGRVVRVLVNKMEGMTVGEYPDVLAEAEQLGFGEPIPVSALHGDGMAEVAAVIQWANDAKEEQLRASADDVALGDDAHGESTDRTLPTGDPNAPLVLAVLGRVNVGKSTLVNQLVELGSTEAQGDDDDNKNEGGDDDVLSTKTTAAAALHPFGQRRVMTGPTPGLTRDSVRLAFEWKPNQTVEVIDTAGIRKALQKKHPGQVPGSDLAAAAAAPSSDAQPQHHPDIESMAIQEAFHACKTAHVVALVIDAGARKLHRSELAMCDAVLKEGRALVLVANKMDLVVEPGYSADQFANDVRDQLEARFPLLRHTPVVPVSALSGANVAGLLDAAWSARERWQQRIPTPRLVRWIRDVQALHAPPSVPVHRGKYSHKMKGAEPSPTKRAKIKYMFQTRSRPPTFVLYCNADKLPDHHLRFLTRHFQDTFQFFGMPVRLTVRRS